MSTDEVQDLRQEVGELTEMLHDDSWRRALREQLAAAGRDPEKLVMGGFVESEEMETYAAFVDRRDLSAWYLETDSRDQIRLLEQRPLAELIRDFPAIAVAVEKAKRTRQE